MKRFNAWLNKFRTVQPLYAALSHPEYGVRERDGRPAFEPGVGHLLADTTPPANVPTAEWRQFLRNVTSDRVGDDRAGAWVLAGLAIEGVKVFAPTASEFTALTKINLNIGWADYRQPFGTFVTAIPEELAGGLSVGGRPAIAVISRADYAGRVVAMVVVTDDPDHAAHSIACWPQDCSATIEETFASYEEVRLDDDREEGAFDVCRRAAMNACLTLVQFGVRRLGYSNPEYAERLAASLLKRKVSDRRKEVNRAAMKLVPDVYAISQDVQLHDTEGGAYERGDDPTAERKPHWRRGHWRRQQHGERFALRRLVFIKPVLINARKFAGDRGQTVASYST